jgi:hypothetical protein
VPETPFHLDQLLTDAPLIGGLAPKLGATHLKVISVRSFVTETEPGLLDQLNRLPISYRWVTRFLPLDREEARRELEKIRKRWFSKRKGLLTLLREALFREEAALLDNDAANQTEDADMSRCKNSAPMPSQQDMPRSPSRSLKADEEQANEAVRQVQQVADAWALSRKSKASTPSRPGSAACRAKPMPTYAGQSSYRPASRIFCLPARCGRDRRATRISMHRRSCSPQPMAQRHSGSTFMSAMSAIR